MHRRQVAASRDPADFVSEAAAIGPKVIAATLAEAVKAGSSSWPSVSGPTGMLRRRLPTGAVTLGFAAVDLGSFSEGGCLSRREEVAEVDCDTDASGPNADTGRFGQVRQ